MSPTRHTGEAPSEVDPVAVEAVREFLALRGGTITPQRVAEALRSRGRPVGDATVLAVHEAVRRDVVGAGLLDPLLATPGVTDVLVNGPDQVWIDTGEGLRRCTTRFPDDESVRRLAQRLAASGGRRLDDASPYVDLRLADGTRFHAVLAPISRPGTALSLRVPPTRVFSLAELVTSRMVPPEGSGLLARIVASRLAFLITGGTGTGKTTLLSSVLSLVPPTDRMVLVEDASELRPEHPHVVGLEARPANLEGAGEIPLRVLVRQALRMRPDRLVVGEVRGAEVVDLLAALNTGHEGGCGTLHANSAEDVPARVEALAAAAGLSREATHAQFSSAVDVVLHLRRTPQGRRLTEVAVPVRGPDGLVTMAWAVRFDPVEGRAEEGPGSVALAERLAR